MKYVILIVSEGNSCSVKDTCSKWVRTVDLRLPCRAHVCLQCTDTVLTYPLLHASLSELRNFPQLNHVLCYLFGVEWDSLFLPCRLSCVFYRQPCFLLMFLPARISLTTPLPRSCCPHLTISLSDTIFVMYSYFICFSSLLHPLFLFLLVVSLLLYLPCPLLFFAIVSSVRRGPVLFTSLSPQARSSLLYLQPVPETRVPSLRPAQPPPTLFLQYRGLPRPFTPHHPAKYPHFLPALLPKPATPWRRPRPSRHPRGGGITSWGWRSSKLCRRRGSIATAQPASILGIPGPPAAALRRQISV